MCILLNLRPCKVLLFLIYFFQKLSKKTFRGVGPLGKGRVTKIQPKCSVKTPFGTDISPASQVTKEKRICSRKFALTLYSQPKSSVQTSFGTDISPASQLKKEKRYIIRENLHQLHIGSFCQ